MSAQHVLPFIVASIMLPSGARAAETLWTEVRVRVYDSTAQPAADRQAALDVAASIMSPASVELAWRNCGPQGKGRVSKGTGEGQGVGVGAGEGCDSPMRHGELAVRIVATPVPSDHQGYLPLGNALIDPRARTGVLATIYFDRVVWVASQTGADRRVLLGRAIAHELGHLLLATSAHGTGGLMRAVWSRGELRHGQTSYWMFTEADAAAIAARARRRPSLAGAIR